MGANARVLFIADGPVVLEGDLPVGFEIVELEPDPKPEYDSDRATHKVKSYYYHYDEYYERGPWPQICHALMLLHSCPTISKVFYGDDEAEVPECTVDDVLRISRHFMMNGHRPYRNK